MEGENLQRLPLRKNLSGQGLLLCTLALISLGVVMVFSAAAGDRPVSAWWYRRDIRQAIFAAVAMLAMLAFWRIDYRWLSRRPWPDATSWLARRAPSPAGWLLLFGIVTSVLVFVWGYKVGRCVRWLRWGPVGFQPSEVLKFAVLIVLAAFLSRPDRNPRHFRRTFLPALALVALACGLVVTQDFGTAVIIGLAAAALMLMAGVPWRHFLLPVLVAALGFYVFVMRDAHRRQRIESLMDPITSTRPASYQPRQALISIASGASAAGLGAGVAKHGYLPADSTDFIFSILCEELGLPGVLLLVGLLLAWLWLARRAALRAGDRFGALLVGGLAFLVGLQAAMHLAVNVRCLPPTGVSLPFVSAGGTSLVGMAVAAAMIVSVTARPRAEASCQTQTTTLPPIR